MKWQKGYTLIEILVALTIIVILFGFGYVSYRDFSRRQALSGEVKQVQGDLRLTQQMALSGQKPVDPAGVKPADPKCLDPYTLSGYDFHIISGSEYEIRAVCSGGAVSAAKDVVLPSGILISPAVIGGIPPTLLSTITFNVLGRGTNIPGSADIKLTQVATNSTAKITVTSGGDIK